MTRVFLVILLLIATATLYAQQHASEIRVNEVFRKTPLPKVLKIIQTKYDVKIAYDHSLVQNIIVAVKLQDLTIAESMQRLLETTPLTFYAVNDNVVIAPRPVEQNKLNEEKTKLTLSGNVVDGESEETLPQATIRVIGTQVATTTNTDGFFSVLNVPSDTCSIEIRYLGYLTKIVQIKQLDTSRPVRIKLRSDTKILNEVVILDEYNQAVHQEELPGTLAFNPKSLSSLPSMGEQDIFRSLQMIPGVSATDETSAGLTIRGSHPSYNLTLLDGMTIYQQDHFFGSFSIINSDIIKDARVHKGMFDAKYGSRVSGVVDLTTKEGNALRPSFNVKLNMINLKAIAEIPIGRKWSVFIAARRSVPEVAQSRLFKSLFDIVRVSNDQVQFLLLDQLGSARIPQYHFFDANTKITFRPTLRDKLSLSLYASRDRMTISDSASLGENNQHFTLARDEAIRWGNNGASIRWARQWSDRYYTNVRMSDSKFFRRYRLDQRVELDESRSSYLFAYENSIADLSYGIDNEWLFRENLSFEFGISGARQQTDIHLRDEFTIDGELPDGAEGSEFDQSWMHSLYGSFIFSPTKKLTANAGARLVSYYNDLGKLYFEPRLTMRYKMTEQINFKTGYGRSNQFVTQMFYPSSTGSISGAAENFWVLSSPDGLSYPVIFSDHVSAGATFNKRQFSFDGEFYYKVNTGVIIDENRNYGKTNSYGLDLMLQKTIGIHKGWIAYSISRSTQSHPNILNGDRAPSWQDQRHELKIVDMLTLGNWNLSTTLIYGSGKPYPKYTARYFRDDNGIINRYELFLDYTNQSRLPAYFKIDLAAAYRLRLGDYSEMEIGLSIHNVTDHKNVKSRRIDSNVLEEAVFNNQELPAAYNDIVLLGFSPSLFLNVSF